MSGVAIFVDYENLAFVLQHREYCRLNHHQIGEELLEYSRGFGALKKAFMWAEWDRFLSSKRQEHSAQALLTEQGFDCLYLLRPSDRSYTEQAILKKIGDGEGLDRIILVSGDYFFPKILSDLKTNITLITVSDEDRHSSAVDLATFPHAEWRQFQDIISSKDALIPLQTPHGMDPAAFYIWMQCALQEELRRRNWRGMSFHMLARLLVERSICEEDIEAQFYINQAVREGFLERLETELPTGRRVLLKPTIVERSHDPIWSFDEEFRWVQLVWALDLILERNPWWEYVTFSRLREELEQWSLVKGADELQQMVGQAVERGIYNLTIEEGDPPLCRKKYKYTLGDIDARRKRMQEIPALILRIMRSLLKENPHWHGVSFSKLLDELADHPQLEEGMMWVNRQRLKEWCNFLVAIGFLHAFRGRPRLIDGELRDPPTLLRVVPEHAWVQHLDQMGDKATETRTAEPEETDNNWRRDLTLRELDYYRLVVVIEHYLHISNNDAVVAGWMPMSTLFHVMGRSLDRAFCNAVVRSAREKGIIEILTHDPRPGQHPARGAHLDLDHPLVGEARKRLLALLEICQTLQDRNNIVDLYTLENRLQQDEFFGDNEEERLGWIELLREENLIMVRPMAIPETTDGSMRYQCTLNVRDRYVLALLESLYADSDEARERVFYEGPSSPSLQEFEVDQERFDDSQKSPKFTKPN